MSTRLKAVARFLAVSVIGYLVIAALQVLVLEVGLGGGLSTDSPVPILALAMIGTVASGLIGGYVTARLGGLRPLLYITGVLGALILDAIYVIANNIGGHPVWFSLGGALTLVAATAVGGWIRARTMTRIPR